MQVPILPLPHRSLVPFFFLPLLTGLGTICVHPSLFALFSQHSLLFPCFSSPTFSHSLLFIFFNWLGCFAWHTYNANHHLAGYQSALGGGEEFVVCAGILTASLFCFFKPPFLVPNLVIRNANFCLYIYMHTNTHVFHWEKGIQQNDFLWKIYLYLHMNIPCGKLVCYGK